jgi:TM2 domain-containing membrane protein YozV
MQCRNCHKELKEHARFCAECGTPVPLETQINPTATSPGAVGTRDQSKRSDLIYPKTPPLSPHLCWLNLLLGGLAQIIYGQVGKGLVILSVIILSNLILPVLLAVFIGIASIIDAYMTGAYLKQGKPVGKWQFFPGA